MLEAVRRLQRDQAGYTLIEMMVVILVLSLLLTAFYAFLFGGERAATDGRQWLEMNQTARLAFERLTRELREADQILSTSTPDPGTMICFQADFDASGGFVNGIYQPDISPDEKLCYRYDAVAQQLLVWSEADSTPRALAENVTAFRLRYYGSEPRLNCAVADPPSFSPTCTPDPEGIVTWQEIDRSPDYGIQGFGNSNGELDVERNFITSIVIEMTVTVAPLSHKYRTAVELRNTFK